MKFSILLVHFLGLFLLRVAFYCNMGIPPLQRWSYCSPCFLSPLPSPQSRQCRRQKKEILLRGKWEICMQNRDTIYSDTKRKLDFLKLLRGGEKKIPFILIKPQYLNSQEDHQILQHPGSTMSGNPAGLGTMTPGRIQDYWGSSSLPVPELHHQ